MPTDATHFINGPSKREYYKRDGDIWYWWTDGRWKRQIGDKRYRCLHYNEISNAIPV